MDDDGYSLALCVYTTLESDEKSLSIPPTFGGFPVITHAVGGLKQKFLNTWITAFQRLCGWNESTIQKNITYLLPDLENPPRGVVYYRGALYWVARILVDAFAPDPSVDGNRVLLERELKEALEHQPPRRFIYPDTDPHYDWDEAKKRVARAFESFGIQWTPETLPVREGPCLG